MVHLLLISLFFCCSVDKGFSLSLDLFLLYSENSNICFRLWSLLLAGSNYAVSCRGFCFALGL